MLAYQIRLTPLSAAIVFRVHPFLAQKHWELPFLAVALLKRGTDSGEFYRSTISRTEIYCSWG